MRPLLLAPALLGLLLSGCAGQPEIDAQWQPQQARLQALTQWQAEGKLALRNARQAESASLFWAQHNNNTELRLSGPIGLGATTLVSDGSTLEIHQGDDTRRYDISSPEAIARETGWDLPLQSLHHWLKGLPSPSLEKARLEIEDGELKQLQQSGWTVTYERYGLFQGYALPTRLLVERDDTRARLLIRQWNIGPA